MLHRVCSSSFFVVLLFAGLSLTHGEASAITLDFSTDDGGTALEHGQIVDAAFDAVQEFGNVVDISSTQIGGGSGHLGVTVFDTTNGPFGADADLGVGLGNALILQNNAFSSTSAAASGGLKYDTPNDEANASDRGSIVFDFLIPNVSVLEITLIDLNGGNTTTLTLTDSSGDIREWTVTASYTGDTAFDTLDFTDLSPQVGVGGGVASVTTDDIGFDAGDVVSLEVAFEGGPVSGALDNLTFVPEPTSLLFVGLGLGVLATVTRRIRS